MAQFTIETSLGIDDFITQFMFEVVGNGKRFKTCHFEEADKNSFDNIYDFNFFASHKDLPSLTSTDDFKVTFDDDAYVLPPNVVLPALAGGSWLFGFEGLQGGTLGAYLMALQYAADSGYTDFETFIFANKIRIPLFNTVLPTELLGANLVPNGDMLTDDVSGFGAVNCTKVITDGVLNSVSLSGTASRIEIDLTGLTIGEVYKLTVNYSVPSYGNQQSAYHVGFDGDYITPMDSLTPDVVESYMTTIASTIKLRIYVAIAGDELNITRIALQSVTPTPEVNGWVPVNKWIGE